MSHNVRGKSEFTVGELSEWIDVKNTTIHRWSEDYSDYLSESANPEKGEERLYTFNDAHVIWTIKSLRELKVSHGDITLRLEAGLRIEPDHLPHEEKAKPTPASPENILRRMQQTIEEQATEIEQLKSELSTQKGKNEALIEQLSAQREQLFDLVLKITRGNQGS